LISTAQYLSVGHSTMFSPSRRFRKIAKRDC